ncbi:uncharacterized protein [Ptychodera flava]|uniref:uncharacterized protein n=1 Tax=Ptychodera flava TaxID=63121 RepID=UPI00396A59BD
MLTSNLTNAYAEISDLTQAMDELSEEKFEMLDRIKRMENLHREYRQKQDEINTLKIKLSTLTPRNVNKKIKRRDKKIDAMHRKIQEQTDTIENYVKQVDDLNTERQKLKCELDRIVHEKVNLQKSKSYWKRKACEYRDSSTKSDTTNKHIIHQLENENLELEETISDLLNDNNLVTFQDGKYTDSVRQVYYDLLAHNVSIENCTHIVKSVLKNMLNIDVERLPSKSLTSMLQVEALVLAQAQAATTILEHDKPNTLHSDGTRKKFVDYAGMQVSLPDKSSLSLGFQELLRGSADDYLTATLETFHELSESITQDNEEKQKIYAQLLLKSKNLMSDRHIVNKKQARVSLSKAVRNLQFIQTFGHT